MTFKTRYDASGQIDRLWPELPWLEKVDAILRAAAGAFKPVQENFLLVLVDRYIQPALTAFQKLKDEAGDEQS